MMPPLGRYQYYRLYRRDGLILGGTLNWRIAEMWETEGRRVEVADRVWDTVETIEFLEIRKVIRL